MLLTVCYLIISITDGFELLFGTSSDSSSNAVVMNKADGRTSLTPREFSSEKESTCAETDALLGWNLNKKIA